MSLNPLSHIGVFGDKNTEPTVDGFVEIETDEPRRTDPVSDLIILSPFRSGKPLELRRFRDLASLANVHDPGRNEDQGVGLARMAKTAFADRNVFGAPLIITVRVDPALAASATLQDGASNDLVKIERADYGSHGNGPGATVSAGTNVGKKLTLKDPTGLRVFIGDDLGILLTIQYTGDGTAASLSILNAVGKIAYTGQPSDADIVTVNGIAFEFDSNSSVGPGNVSVTIGVDADATFANLVTAIGANVDNVIVSQDTTNDVVTITGTEAGVVLVETLDTGGVFAVTHQAPAARLQVAVTGATDGSQDLDIALTQTGFSSIDNLASYIDKQQGYTATISPYANKFLDSAGLDPVSGVNVKTSSVPLSGYVAAIVDWVNTRTREQYVASELGRAEPDEASYAFAGGKTPVATATDWENALTEVGANQEVGGILLPDTDDPSIFAMVTAFIEEQRTAGKWFRAFFGAQPALTAAQYDQIAGAIDHERCRMTVQRLGVFGQGGQVEYLHPVFFAAALAGGSAGNLPYKNPLTNKRIRSAGIHESDSFDKVAREALIQAGITVAKREEDRILVSYAVTTSRDRLRRMVRVMSEIDTVDLVDSNVRTAFMGFRGRWSDPDVRDRAWGTLYQVLQRFVDDRALSPSVTKEGERIPPFRIISVLIQAGVMTVKYQIYIGGELDFITLLGHANYARIAGEVGSGLAEREFQVPLAA